jgi:RimJ/RimL family protein N-acetyltransferase
MKNDIVSLRALEEIDIELVRKWNFDPEITEFFPARWPVSASEQKKWFEAQQSSATKKRLLILDTGNAEPIGLIAFMDIDHTNKNCEVGITIGNKSYWGKPHAFEAMKLGLNFLFDQLNMHLVYLKVMAENERAIGFFKKCGFVSSGILRDMIYTNGRFNSWNWMSINRTEYEEMIK